MLGELSTRLYDHVGELERVGRVKLARAETKSGTVHTYYRSVSRFLNVPTSLLHDDSGSPEAIATVDWFCSMMQNGAMDVRHALGAAGPDFDRDLTFITRNYVRTTPERAREFVRKLDELQAELLDADDVDATFRITFTASLVPTPPFLASPCRRPPRSGRAPRRAGAAPKSRSGV